MMESPAFWVMVSFAIFVAAAFKPGRKFLIEALDTRADKIKDEMDEAARLREEAQATLATYQRKQREAVEETKEIIDHATQEVARMRAHAAKDLEVTLSRRQQQALDRITQAELEAIQDVRNMAATIAIHATKLLLEDYLDEPRSNALIEGAIADLPKILH
ncbi:MAG: F0F1 ATP synthase subunit B [Rhodospirillaceae bacterium]|jgi:F-type H+-transporting ATPase subunit b|nr:F0F1 ATP synthase subunit B [Rhodospirillaceae bacterium]MBT5373171.1 F0F1 ATP synthase subunit B [Rhodospirillaceae bacterium]MBT5659477.1 F0F1 ATP synthase subunit B [Rhodospirillaceae bacterium]MBT5752306.1 F0F1 ATP synthase subunit B [Rhodospirillaceae bacterium]